MATKLVKVTYEFKGLADGLNVYWDDTNIISKLNKEYNAKIAELEKAMVENRSAQRELPLRTDLLLEEMHAQALELRTAHAEMAEKQKALEEEKKTATATYRKEKAAAEKYINAIEGLYDAYVLGIQAGTWDKTGGFQGEDGKFHNVPNSFADVMVKLCKDYGMKFNHKSEVAFPTAMCTWIGADPRTAEEYTKRNFCRAFASAVKRYAEENGGYKTV